MYAHTGTVEWDLLRQIAGHAAEVVEQLPAATSSYQQLPAEIGEEGEQGGVVTAPELPQQLAQVGWFAD